LYVAFQRDEEAVLSWNVSGSGIRTKTSGIPAFISPAKE
jgi:hypothetical protein